jgi:LacI family transcriptional regulator
MKALSKAGVSVSVSISDVAKRASVSISTVSRVLNGRELVNERTRARVEVAIRELGYRPNPFARGLMLRRSEVIGLLLPDLHGEFYSEVIRGATGRARELGYNLVVSSAQTGDEAHSLLDAMNRHTILDGLAVMVSEVTSRVQESLGSAAMPFVVLDSDVAGIPHDSVIIDQRAGASALVSHLLDARGVERLVFVGGPSTNIDTAQRLDAARQILAARGREIAAADVHFLDYQYETAYTLAQRQLDDWVSPRACVFAANDEMAAGIVAAAAAADVDVPRGLAVVGFDDTRIARMTRPALTTVRVPMSQMGTRAVDLLVLRIAQPERPPTLITLQPELIVRQSCGTP